MCEVSYCVRREISDFLYTIKVHIRDLQFLCITNKRLLKSRHQLFHFSKPLGILCIVQFTLATFLSYITQHTWKAIMNTNKFATHHGN